MHQRDSLVALNLTIDLYLSSGAFDTPNLFWFPMAGLWCKYKEAVQSVDDVLCFSPPGELLVEWAPHLFFSLQTNASPCSRHFPAFPLLFSSNSLQLTFENTPHSLSCPHVPSSVFYEDSPHPPLCLSHLFARLIFSPSTHWVEPPDSTAFSLFCQIAKLAIVFNHSHTVKSHEVIRNV